MSGFLPREMQRGLPAVRTVSIPYHGMTIPIPSNNSFYSPSTTSNSNQTAVQNMAEETSPASHQIRNAIPNTAQVCNGGKDTPAPAPSIACTPMLLPVASTACSPMPSVPHSPSPPKSPWLHTGRGRALQQLVSWMGPGVGRGHLATPTNSGAASPVPPAGLSDPGMSAGPDEPVSDTVTTDIAEDHDRYADTHDLDARNADDLDLDAADDLDLVSATGYSNDHNLNASAGDHSLDVRGSAKDLNQALPARREEPTVDVKATGSAENHTGTSAKSDRVSPPEDTAKVDDAKIEVADHVIQTKAKPIPASLALQTPSCTAAPIPASLALQSPSCTAAPILSPSPGTTTRSPRKSRISLAIQFKGVCSSPQSVQQVGDRSSTTPQKTTGELSVGHFTVQNITPASPSGKTSTGDVKGKIQPYKNTDVTVPTMKSGKNDSSSGSQDEVLTQVEEVFEGCGPVSLSSMPPLLSDSSEGEEVGTREREEFPGGVSSDDEGEGELEGARMGLSAAELEMSISLHQRNTHRNRMETKRIQRRIQGTKDVLAADLAEQCAEDDTFNYDITHDREQEMARVLDLQLQFDAQSLEKTSFAEEVFQLGSENHDKLMQVELKHEVEAQEVEKQLQLVRKQAALLQAKSEMTV